MVFDVRYNTWRDLKNIEVTWLIIQPVIWLDMFKQKKTIW
jgi:hypothetical protein